MLTRAFWARIAASYVRAIIRNVFRDAGFKQSPFCPVSVGFGPCLLELIWSYWHEEAMLVQTTNAIALRFQNVAPQRPRSARRTGARCAAAAERLHLGLHPGRAEPALRAAPRLRVPPPIRTRAGRAREPRPSGRLAIEVPAGVSRSAAAHRPVLPRSVGQHGHARSVPAAHRAAGSAHDSRGGRAQPVPRSAVDRAQRDARAAVAARAHRRRATSCAGAWPRPTRKAGWARSTR